MSGVVLTIPRHGLQNWGGSGALHGVDSAVGAEGTVDDDENIGLSGLIAPRRGHRQPGGTPRRPGRYPPRPQASRPLGKDQPLPPTCWVPCCLAWLQAD